MTPGKTFIDEVASAAIVRRPVTISFYGDDLLAFQEGERIWVVFRRMCESLGIDYPRQLAKLSGQNRVHWASDSTVAQWAIVASDGKLREMACVDLDALPMWLATIDVGRVRPESRDKVIAYQRECARVLREHFLGRPTAASAPAPPVDVEAITAAVANSLKELVPVMMAPVLGFMGAMLKEHRRARRGASGRSRKASASQTELALDQSPRPPVRQPEDSAERFLRECCVLEPSGRVARMALRITYERWCEDRGLYPHHARGFAERVREHLRSSGVPQPDISVSCREDGIVRDGWRGLRLANAQAGNVFPLRPVS